MNIESVTLNFTYLVINTSVNLFHASTLLTLFMINISKNIEIEILKGVQWHRQLNLYYFVKMANAAPIEVFDSFLEKYLVPIFPGFRNFPDFFSTKTQAARAISGLRKTKVIFQMWWKFLEITLNNILTWRFTSKCFNFVEFLTKMTFQNKCTIISM